MSRPEVQAAAALTDGQRRAVLALCAAAAEADGESPLSEQVVLHLRHGGDPGEVHLLLLDGDALLGYAHLDPVPAEPGEPGEPAPDHVVAELFVDPTARRCGHGRRLLSAVEEQAPKGLHVWAHGDHPAARALAASAGFTAGRHLWRMRRSLHDGLPAADLPPQVRLRAFRPGADDADWVALNARAFADHPEQGRWTVADLQERIAEPWFDPAGFLIAERVGGNEPTMVGFHWTKIHEGGGPGERHGEVYVVGVDPAAQGGGLGRALTLAGLRHLAERGLDWAKLYVDADNAAAVALYRRLGFTLVGEDVLYRR